MKSNYRKLGEFIRQVDVRNVDGKEENLLGVSVKKVFIPSIANTVGTDFTKYKVVKKGQFTYIPDTSRRGDKIGIALLEDFEEGLVSNVYTVFEIIDEEQLLSKYLMLWFSRPEFDRYARFKSHGSVREVMDWEEMCNVELPVPNIDVQRKIVEVYKSIEERINLKRKVNDNLREIATVKFFEKIRYCECDSDNCQKTEIGTYPSDWKIITLGDALETIIDRRGVTPTKLGGEWSETGIIALSAKSIKNHELVNLDIANHVETELYNRWMQQKLQPQDVIMTSEAPLGEFYYLADFSEYCLSQRLFAMRANKNLIEPTLLYFQLTDIIGKHQIDIRKTGTTVTGIRQSELIKVPIVVPPQNVQSEFAKLCDPIMVTIEKNANEIAHLQSLCAMLLTHLSSR